MIKNLDNYHAKIKEMFTMKSDELSDAQREFLRRMNKELFDIEKIIKQDTTNLIKTGYARLSDPDDWVKDYEIESVITFYMREDDPDYDDDDEDANILVKLEEWFKHGLQDRDIGKNKNHNIFFHNDDHPMNKEHHCYLYHQLYYNTELRWSDILRIGNIWLDINIVYQKWIALNDDENK